MNMQSGSSDKGGLMDWDAVTTRMLFIMIKETKPKLLLPTPRQIILDSYTFTVRDGQKIESRVHIILGCVVRSKSLREGL